HERQPQAVRTYRGELVTLADGQGTERQRTDAGAEWDRRERAGGGARRDLVAQLGDAARVAVGIDGDRPDRLRDGAVGRGGALRRSWSRHLIALPERATPAPTLLDAHLHSAPARPLAQLSAKRRHPLTGPARRRTAS